MQIQIKTKSSADRDELRISSWAGGWGGEAAGGIERDVMGGCRGGYCNSIKKGNVVSRSG